MDTFIQQIINGLVLGSMYALVALGYTMVYGVLNLINFAHGDADDRRHDRPDHPQLLNHACAGLARLHQAGDCHRRAIPVCMIVNVIIERRLPPPAQCAASGAADYRDRRVDLLNTFAMMIWGRNPLPFPQLLPSDPIAIGGALISPTQILLLALALMSMAGLVLLVEKTRMGRAMRATAENPRVAGLMGVDSNKVIIATFALGAALAAVAGVMWGANYASIQFSMGFLPGLKAFCAAVLGGIGNIYGAMLGGIVLGIIESLGAGYIGDLTGGFLGSHYQDIFAFVVLIIVLTVRPSGIMGERVADRA
jgi:branched-chain amino acid transport system permease protein